MLLCCWNLDSIVKSNPKFEQNRPFLQCMLDVSGPLTASKLLADYNLAVLTSFVQKKKKKKKLVERFNVKAIVCNFTPRGIKVNSKSQPQHLSLTLMSRLSWNTTSPGAKITHIPRAATGVGEADGKLRNRTGEKKGGDGGGGGAKRQRFCRMQDELRTLVLPCLRLLMWRILTSALTAPVMTEIRMCRTSSEKSGISSCTSEHTGSAAQTSAG